MVNEEILGGLKSALNRGESLRQAMMSFYNAGYKKEDIEAAARALQEQESGQSIQQPQQIQQAQSIHEKSIQQPQPTQQLKSKPKTISTQPVKTIQRVSNYEQETPKPRKEWLLFVMIVLLLVLLGALAGIFFFKSELMEFFNKLFS